MPVTDTERQEITFNKLLNRIFVVLCLCRVNFFKQLRNISAAKILKTAVIAQLISAYLNKETINAAFPVHLKIKNKFPVCIRFRLILIFHNLHNVIICQLRYAFSRIQHHERNISVLPYIRIAGYDNAVSDNRNSDLHTVPGIHTGDGNKNQQKHHNKTYSSFHL